ncbi:MAG: nicotinate phosphoribosyltransferase [Candidatus Omnitrophota bacterium]|nr:nicotinate phosphoribosyltransferase [Candidatus Omnitrophota bacterium]
MESPGLSQLTPLYTDLYQLTMAQGYFLTGRHRQHAVFDLFFRSNPFKGGYLLAVGMDEALRVLSGLRFQRQDLAYLKRLGFAPSFLTYLERFRFRLSAESVIEGEVVFPREPLLRVEGSLLECQLAETLLINFVHFPSLVATKASRIVRAAEGRSVLEFGLRRAQGLAGIAASRAAYIGGVDGTSNVMCGQIYGVPVFGTQAHSWIQAIRDEKKAFLEFSRIQREKTVLLIDTYNTLKSGLPHLLQTLQILRREGIAIRGVRIDSGDLAYLSKKLRAALDEAGYPEILIFASGSLDEYIIESLLKQNARIDGFGVGTKLSTAYDEPALDMVYKLCMIEGHSEIKISDNLEKMNEPGRKRTWRFYSDSKQFLLDAIGMEDESKPGKVIHPFFEYATTPVRGLKGEVLLRQVMKNGKFLLKGQGVEQARAYARERLALLPDEHKRFYYPHTYRVGITQKLFRMKEKLFAKRSKEYTSA